MQFDLTKPNPGRMVDYWLGGDHNFEIDRQLANQVAQTLPIVADLARKQRNFVNRAVHYFYTHGIRTIIDYGAGLPTCDNTHLVAQALDPTIKVVYSDIDAFIIAYAQELLHDSRNAIYLHCDAIHPATLLDSPQVIDFIGNERRVGFLFVGLATWLTDEQVDRSWQTLYDWAAPGSFMAVSTGSEHWAQDPELHSVQLSYAKSGIQSFLRTTDELRGLMSPWQLTSEGFIPSMDWGLPAEQQSTRKIGYTFMLSK